MTCLSNCVTWLDQKKIDKNNQTFVDLRTKCLSEPNTSRETKLLNVKSIPVIHTTIGQVNIVTIKRGLVQENILEALMEKQNIILIILLSSLSYIILRKKFLALYKNTYQRMLTGMFQEKAAAQNSSALGKSSSNGRSFSNEQVTS